MLFVCNYDNGKGDPYAFTLDRKPLKWRCRDSCNVSIQDDYGVTHTAIFNSEYQAALYCNFIDYTFDDEDKLPKHIATELRQCFCTDLWSITAKDTGYAFVLWSVQFSKSLDYESFRKEVSERKNIRRQKNDLLPHNKRHEPYDTGRDHDFRFLHYVIRAMEDVGHIKMNRGKIEMNDKGVPIDEHIRRASD